MMFLPDEVKKDTQKFISDTVRVKTISLLIAYMLIGSANPSSVYAASNVSFSKSYGGLGGTPFVDMKVPGTRVSEITIRSGSLIDNIRVSYVYRGQTFTKSHGGNGGSARTLRLDSNEYITEFGGRSGSYVDSIYIKTNTGRLMRWGGAGGENSFRFKASRENPIVGFWGRSGSLIDAIGVISKSALANANSTSDFNSLSKFKPKSQQQGQGNGGGGKAESVESSSVPYPPDDGQNERYWENHSDRLFRSINAVVKSKKDIERYQQDEREKCHGHLYCEIEMRSQAISFVLGAE